MRILIVLCFFHTHLLCAQVVTQVRVHSHNDYRQSDPFWGAYRAGAYSIEVDIFLKRDTLFVAHEEADIVAGTKDLKGLYLEPLKECYEKDGLRPVQLLIDIKSPAEETLLKLIQLLDLYRAMVRSGTISWVISGNRPEPKAYGDYPDYLLFDYQSLDDVQRPDIWERVALISLPFYRYASWPGTGELPMTERRAIAKLIDRAHIFGKPFRFWATPDTELAWKTLAEMGVDLINTDTPAACVESLGGH